MLNPPLFNLKDLSTYPLINDVVVYPLRVNQDERGFLVEALKKDWQEVFDKTQRPFTQSYYSITNAGVARDQDRWHYHPTKQEDRFVVVSGNILVAVYDWRQNSPTLGQINFFPMGEKQGEDGQYLLLIPKNVLHCFKVSQEKSAILINFPTTLYDSAEEGRLPFSQAPLADGSYFSWEKAGSF